MGELYNAELKVIEAKLSAPRRASLEELKALFEKFQTGDGESMYDEYVDGSGRGTIARDQEILDQSNFSR